jgi:hypothetical protein
MIEALTSSVVSANLSSCPANAANACSALKLPRAQLSCQGERWTGLHQQLAD